MKNIYHQEECRPEGSFGKARKLCSFEHPEVDYYLEEADTERLKEEADSFIDGDFTRLYLRRGNAWTVIRFAEREETGSEEWKRIRAYCLEKPFALRMFREAHQRSFRKHGAESEEFIEEIRHFLAGFCFEAGIFDHQKKKNYIEDLFDQAALHPDRIAVVDMSGERTMTYAEFGSLIKRTAAKIQSFSLPANSFIIVNMGRCREYLAAMYAIVYAGHALIPLVPETPKEREEYIRDEAESPLTIREDFFDDIDAWPESEGVKRKDRDPALMLYTSGSTGRPKGVLHAFKPLSDCYQHACFILEGIDPIIYASSIAYSFAAISVDTFHVFCMGGTMHILSEEARKDVKLMNAYYRKHGITVGNVHPRLHKLLDGGDQLKRIFTSGHRITDFYSDRFETFLGYGLAETFTVPTYFKLDRAYEATPVGKSCGGYTVILCDENGNEVKDGERGEVRIAGNLAEGYFKMPELTAKTFEKQADGTVLLHTHDIGYKDENGDLILVNRDDWLVKISGMSVNPAEIDFAMSRIPGIKESAAKGFTDANGNSYICDFYVTEDVSLTPKVLREILAKSLMSYMIPSVFERMDALPQTISSKVDYKALKAPERIEGYEAPEDPLEKRIAAAFEAVIGRGRIGRKDDFFEAGGDSLSLIELLVILDDTSLSIAEIAEYRTVERIAAFLKAQRETKKEAVREDEAFPLTPYQAHYIRACESAGHVTMGNTPCCIRLEGNYYTEEEVRDAFRKVLAAHPALRTVISSSQDGTILSRAEADPGIGIETADLPDGVSEEILQNCIKPFALFNHPLVHARLFRTKDSLVLFFDVHHIVFDHYSMRIFVRDLFAAMRKEALKEDAYPEYLLGMKKRTERGEIAALKKELTAKYEGYVRHPQFDSSAFAWQTEMIERHVLLRPECMKLCSDGKRAGIQAGLIAACLLAVHKDTGKEKVLSGWLYSGRDSAEKMNMTGLMITSLLAAADFSKIKTAGQLLDAVRLDMRESLRTAELSPGSLLQGYAEEDLITVNYTAYTKEEPPVHARRISLMNRNTANTCVFYVILNEKEDGFGDLLFKYNDSVYSKEHIERFITYFFDAVQELSDQESWMAEVR